MNPERLPKCLRRFAHLIDEISDERSNGDGYWVYLIPGYWSPENETHCIHEDSPTACVPYLKAVKPCPYTPSHEECHDYS